MKITNDIKFASVNDHAVDLYEGTLLQSLWSVGGQVFRKDDVTFLR